MDRTRCVANFEFFGVPRGCSASQPQLPQKTGSDALSGGIPEATRRAFDVNGNLWVGVGYSNQVTKFAAAQLRSRRNDFDCSRDHKDAWTVAPLPEGSKAERLCAGLNLNVGSSDLVGSRQTEDRIAEDGDVLQTLHEGHAIKANPRRVWRAISATGTQPEQKRLL